MQYTTEQVNEMLNNYRGRSARIALIESEISDLKDMYEDMSKTIVEDSISATASLTGMPRGTKISDPTGRLAIDIASGETPKHLQDIKDDIDALYRERRCLITPCRKVDALLKALNEKQEFILRRKAIDQMQWREIIFTYKKTFGIEYSRQGAKNIYKASLLCLYKVAGCDKIKK